MKHESTETEAIHFEQHTFHICHILACPAAFTSTWLNKEIQVPLCFWCHIGKKFRTFLSTNSTGARAELEFRKRAGKRQQTPKRLINIHRMSWLHHFRLSFSVVFFAAFWSIPFIARAIGGQRAMTPNFLAWESVKSKFNDQFDDQTATAVWQPNSFRYALLQIR